MSASAWKGFVKLFGDLTIIKNTFVLYFGAFLIAFVLSVGSLTYVIVGKVDLQNTSSLYLAKLKSDNGVRLPFSTLNYFDEAGNKHRYEPSDYSRIAELKNSQKNVFSKVSWIAGFSVLFSVVFAWLMGRIFKGRHGHSEADGAFLRGAKKVEAEDLRKRVEREGLASDILLGGVPMIRDHEARHIYISGDIGAGKSQCLMEILDTLRASGEKAIILDKNGELTQHYFDPNRDVMLAPFDDRTLGWTPFSEGCELFDFERLAASFIPMAAESGENKHWPESARTVFAWLLFKLAKTGHEKSVDEILKQMLISKNEVIVNELGEEQIVKKRQLTELLKGTLAELVIDPEAPDHASSVIGTLIPKIRALYYLRGLEERQEFSLREWAKNEDDKRWVFLRANTDQMDAAGPVLVAWMDTVIKGLLSLEKSGSRKVWAVIDELQSLEKLDSLEMGIHEGRKHGLRFLLGFTSVNELFKKYGREGAPAMLSMCATQVAFRSREASSAKWNSECFGEQERLIDRQGMSLGTNDNLSFNEQRERNAIISPAEIQNLKDFEAFIKFSGDWPAAKIKTAYKDRPVIAKASVPRAIPDFDNVAKAQNSESQLGVKQAPEKSFYDQALI